MDTLNQTPEQIARDNIDRQLQQAGWSVQNKDTIDWSAGPLAVRVVVGTSLVALLAIPLWLSAGIHWLRL